MSVLCAALYMGKLYMSECCLSTLHLLSSITVNDALSELLISHAPASIEAAALATRAVYQGNTLSEVNEAGRQYRL